MNNKKREKAQKTNKSKTKSNNKTQLNKQSKKSYKNKNNLNFSKIKIINKYNTNIVTVEQTKNNFKCREKGKSTDNIKLNNLSEEDKELFINYFNDYNEYEPEEENNLIEENNENYFEINKQNKEIDLNSKITKRRK